MTNILALQIAEGGGELLFSVAFWLVIYPKIHKYE